MIISNDLEMINETKKSFDELVESGLISNTKPKTMEEVDKGLQEIKRIFRISDSTPPKPTPPKPSPEKPLTDEEWLDLKRKELDAAEEVTKR